MQHSTGQYDDLACVPRTRPREGCRRRTTASRHRGHSPARCSCRVVPPIRDARFADLIQAVFMCNSGRARQERVWEFRDRKPKSTLSGPQQAAETTRHAFEPAKIPVKCGLFVRNRETSVRIELRGGPGRTRNSNQTIMSGRPGPWLLASRSYWMNPNVARSSDQESGMPWNRIRMLGGAADGLPH